MAISGALVSPKTFTDTDLLIRRFNAAKVAFKETPRELWPDMNIAVIGCGPVALCAIICALEYQPRRIFVVDSIPNRLQTAASLGCTPLNFKEVDVVAEITKATDNNGVHAVIEGVGLSPALRTAYDVVCPGGKISSFGKTMALRLCVPAIC
jgi:threonine dehydrogenase-like Zn-dependent dehydrogenase